MSFERVCVCGCSKEGVCAGVRKRVCVRVFERGCVCGCSKEGVCAGVRKRVCVRVFEKGCVCVCGCRRLEEEGPRAALA